MTTSAPSALGQAGTPAQAGPILLVDDAATANPDLIDIAVDDNGMLYRISPET